VGIIEAQTGHRSLVQDELRVGLPHVPEILRPSDKITSPTLLSLNTGPWLLDKSREAGQRLYLDEALRRFGLPLEADIVWFLGIWQQTPDVREFGRRWTWQYKKEIPDVADDDVRGSPYAIGGYEPNPQYVRGWNELGRMKNELNRKGIKLFTDFIPNHVAIGHSWTREHPDFFIHLWGREVGWGYGFVQQPGREKTLQIAHGKDPNYRFWEDTLQLNYANQELQDAMIRELINIAKYADGVRVDMAMLVNPDTFLSTWGRYLNQDEIRFLENQLRTSRNFWKTAIREVKNRYPDFKFAAEAYWGEDMLLAGGFDYLYAKESLYKLFEEIFVNRTKSTYDLEKYLKELTPETAGRQLRFIENHDEARAAAKFGRHAVPALEAILAFMPGGMNMIHDGQYDGRTIKTPIQVGRYPNENSDHALKLFHTRMMQLKHSKAVQEGRWIVPDYSMYSGSMIIQQYIHSKGRLTICVNPTPEMSCATLKSVTNAPISVYDPVADRWLPNEIIDHNLSDGFGLVLPPWGVQCVINTPC